MSKATRFDRAFYDRFYRDPAKRVTDARQIERLAAFICSYLKYLDIRVDRVLDLGCGLGLWQKPLSKHFPKAEYVGVEVSAHLCEDLGWERGSVVDYAGEPADLVICQGVLQYLDTESAGRALANLARLSRGALYLEALTREDWAENVDQERTDADVHLRRASFYKKRLAKSFDACGGGLFVPKDSGVVLFELEKG
jgi:SAM-dependent methyltransferase